MLTRDKPVAPGAPPATEAESERPSLGKEIGRSAVWLSVLTLLASAVNYASNLVFSRVLGPASFGDLTALLALSVVIAVPTAAAQTRLAERVAHYEAEGDRHTALYLIRHALAHLAVLAAIATAIYVALIPLTVDALDLQAPGPAIALAPLIALSFMFPVLFGALQGYGRFVAFGVVALAVAVARLAFGVPWAESGGGAGGAIAGQALGMAACFAIGLFLMREHLISRGTGAASAGLRRKPDFNAFAAGAAFVAFAAIANFDIVLAKLFLDSHDSGLYGALSNVAKVVTFLPAAIAVILVPNAAKARDDVRERARVLRVSALLVLATALIVVVPAALAPEFLIETMFGGEYADASDGVLPIALAGAGLSLLYLLVVFTVTIEDRRWTLLLIAGIAAQVTGIGLFHDSPAQVATVQAGVVAIVLLVNELLFHSLLRRPKVEQA